MKTLLPLIYECPHDTFRLACLGFLRRPDKEMLCHLFRARKSQDPNVQRVIQAVLNSSPPNNIWSLKMSAMEHMMNEAKTISDVDDIWNFFKVDDRPEMLKVPWIHVLSRMGNPYTEEDWEHVLTYASTFASSTYGLTNYGYEIRQACLPYLVKLNNSRYNKMLDVFYYNEDDDHDFYLQQKKEKTLAKEIDAEEGLRILCNTKQNEFISTWLENMPPIKYDFAIEMLCQSYMDDGKTNGLYCSCISEIIYCAKQHMEKNQLKGFIEYVIHAMGWYGLVMNSNICNICQNKEFYEAGCERKINYFYKEEKEEVYEKEMKYLGSTITPMTRTMFVNKQMQITNLYLVCRYSGSEPNVIKYIKEQPESFPFQALFGATKGGHNELVEFLIENIYENRYSTVDFALAVFEARQHAGMLDIYKKYIDGIQDKEYQLKLRAAYDFGKNCT